MSQLVVGSYGDPRESVSLEREAQALAEVQRAFADNPESAADAAVNRWLAIDMGHGPQAIHGEVTAWDVSGLPAAHRMARHLLLHDDAEGIAQT